MGDYMRSSDHGTAGVGDLAGYGSGYRLGNCCRHAGTERKRTSKHDPEKIFAH
jgi:hypothetical protein